MEDEAQSSSLQQAQSVFKHSHATNDVQTECFSAFCSLCHFKAPL